MDIVYHLAARVVDYGSYDEFYKPILDGTKNMLEVSSGKVNRFVFVSSICACGIGNHMKGMTESDPCVKTGVFYGDAKLLAEEAVKKCERWFTDGYVIVRPANVIGPRSGWVTELGSVIRDGISAYIDGGRYSASLIYIENLVDGLVLCGTEEKASGQTYFFRDDWEVTWKQYFDDLAAMFDKKIRFNLPFGLAWFLAGLSDKLARFFDTRPIITKHAVGLMGRDCDVVTTKAQKELGWKTKVSYSEAIEEIRKWVNEYMNE
jgi:nucleoside-diphosphate-sugar epimerase